MSITNIIAIITDVGMWVTPRALVFEKPITFLELSTSKQQTNKAFRSIVILIAVHFKTEKRPILTTNRFSLQAGIKPPYNKINKLNHIGY
jgi:hypothetical protein